MTGALGRERIEEAAGGQAEARAACREALAPLVAALPETFGLGAETAGEVLLEAFLRQAGRAREADGAAGLEALARVASDVVLAAAYRQGTPEAVTAFRARFQGLIRCVTRQCLSAADAQEAEGESWAALWEKLGQYEGRSTLRTWMYVVVRRWCWNRSRQAPPPGPDWSPEEGRSLEERMPSPDPELGESVACAEFSRALDTCTVEALRHLSPQERALLRFRFVHQMPLEEVRHRPEIYEEGEPEQPVYGITRRVQRAGKKVRELALSLMTRRGYDAAECTRLLRDCEHVESDLARKLVEELSEGTVQISADELSNPTESPDSAEPGP